MRWAVPFIGGKLPLSFQERARVREQAAPAPGFRTKAAEYDDAASVPFIAGKLPLPFRERAGVRVTGSSGAWFQNKSGRI